MKLLKNIKTFILTYANRVRKPKKFEGGAKMDKDQIAYEQYGLAYDNLEENEQEAVDARFADTENEGDGEQPEASGDNIAIEFGRPGINGTKKSIVLAGTNVLAAASQAGMNVRVDKESFQVKESSHYRVGQTLSAEDTAYDGDLILVVTGVDSAN